MEALYLAYSGLNKCYISSTCVCLVLFLLFFNMATIKLEITYMACIIFLTICFKTWWYR